MTSNSAAGSIFRPILQDTVVNPVERKRFVTGAHGSYELEDQPFATGNYAEVFKSKDTTTNATSACKVITLRRPFLTDEERDNIDKEIETLKRLQHENIIAFVDEFRSPDQIYLFSELVRGTTLLEHYRNNNNYMTERDSRIIFRQICNAVEYIHQNGIIHCDIKSENIVIDEDLKIKMIDFGLAKHLTGPEDMTSLHRSTSHVAPEMKEGIETNRFNFNVDIWSLGVLLFRMLVGEYPYTQETEEVHMADQESGLAFLKRDWRPLVDKQSKRTPEVKYLLETILDVDPSRRARMDQILVSDWMLMADDLLATFDMEHSGSACILIPNDVSNSNHTPAQKRQEPWGELTIVPGGFPDAPRRIELKDSSHVLGRADDQTVKILLGSHRSISVRHCIIERDDSGIVMVSNTSLNGTYVNNLLLGKKRSGQLLNGDVLGIVVCPGHLAAPIDPRMGCSLCLKYNVVLYDSEKATPEQLKHRIYGHHTHKGNKRRLPEDRMLDENLPIWGKLSPLNVLTRTEMLQGEKTTIGRGKDCDIVIERDFISREHCIIEWAAEEKKAYLSSVGANRMTVNDRSIYGRLQLRNKDQINLIVPNRGEGQEEIHIGYIFSLLKEEASRKRSKIAPADIPKPVLPPDNSMGGAEENSGDGQSSTHGHP